MELHPEHVAALDGRDERSSVSRLGEDGGFARGTDRSAGVGVDEVEVGAILDPGEQHVLPPPYHLVPADVRERRGVAQDHSPARQDPEHASRQCCSR